MSVEMTTQTQAKGGAQSAPAVALERLVRGHHHNQSCTDSSMLELPLFQADDGGSNPTSVLQVSKMRVRETTWTTAAKIFREWHYRQDWIGGSLKHCFGLWSPEILLGAMAFGDPRHRDKYSDNGKTPCLELRRLALADAAPKNSESYFIGYCLRWIRKNTNYRRIVSYADVSRGHVGTIYKATGFKLVGETAGGSTIHYQGREFHVRSLTIDRDYSRELRDRVASGEAKVVETGAKNIYVREL